MTLSPTVEKPLRLWPGVALVVLQLLIRFALPVVYPDALFFAVIFGVAGSLAIVIWWIFFSRAPKLERWGAIAFVILAMAATQQVADKSISNGMMGMMFVIVATPVVSVAFVIWAVAAHKLQAVARRWALVGAMVIGCGCWTLLRTDGISGDAKSFFAWRWTPTAEDRLLASTASAPVAVPTANAPAVEQPVALAIAPAVVPPKVNTGAGWPGFRGPQRDGIVAGTHIETDWAKAKPVELWRKPIGPGWSSFAVQGDLIYTQEQRGADEIVACYSASTGEPVWTHRDSARFWESNGGAGPRGTPALHRGRAYTFGATGIVNALDARTGAVLWTRNAVQDTGTKIPEWGFASSPLVVGDVVIIAAAGKLAAYDLSTGEPQWYGPEGRNGYSSPHPVTLDGVEQVLLLCSPGVVSVAASDGAKLWEHPLPAGGRITQPAQLAGGDLLLSEGDGNPIHRVSVTRSPAGAWTVEERWTSNALKPNFNDLVIHNGYAFGFDGSLLACVDLKDGKRKWKGGRYGHGQVLMLPDQEVLLVLSEEGELALVSAGSDQFQELGRMPAIEGKTWNHPVLAGEVLLVRNGQEMAAFRVRLANR